MDDAEVNAFHFVPKMCSSVSITISTYRHKYQDYKDFVDAENLMPFGTSDFRNPICFEMRALRNEAYGEIFHPQNNSNNIEMGSMDSSDTFASCNTHPYRSQGDITSNIADSSCALDSNLYVNPLDKSSDNSPTNPDSTSLSLVKKSASGDTGLRSLGATPIEESYCGFGGIDHGSRVSLNDSPQRNYRQTRFLQSARPRTRFGRSLENESQESLETKRNKKSFIPTKGFSSATKILNQHLFGLHGLSATKSGKNEESKSSLSMDSMDSRISFQMEHHKRSKSILKKSDGGGNRNGDPESERLISDSTSGIDVGSGSEFSSPVKHLSSPPARHRQQKSLPLASPTDFDKSRTSKSPLLLLDDITKERQREYVIDNKLKECGGFVRDLPLYICPPPPPMDQSPTEETRLLLHRTSHNPTIISVPRQPNCFKKGPDPSS